MVAVRFFSHHKCATKWLGIILKKYSEKVGLSYFHTHYNNSFPEVNDGIQLYTSISYQNIPPQFRYGTHIIRNPLDLLISSYFSHLYSHSLVDWPALIEHREILKSCDKTTGLYADWTFLERSDFYDGADAPLYSIRTWNYSDDNFLTLKMEVLVADPLEAMCKSFRHSGLPVDVNQLSLVIEESSFEKLSQGRAVGNENLHSHYRKGKEGDWKNHLDESQSRLLSTTYREVLKEFYPEAN